MGRTSRLLAAALGISMIALVACSTADDGGPARDTDGVGSDGRAATLDATTEYATSDSIAKAGGVEAPGLPGDTASSPESAPAPGPGAGIFDRKVVQDASMQLKVKEVQQSFDAVGRIAAQAGGAVYDSSFYSEKDYRVGTLTIRVPTERYQEVLSQLRALGIEVVSESSSASDVTQEYTDLDSRVRNLEATEGQYITLLGKAETVEEILIVQDRLSSVRGEIEQIKGRIQQLDKLTSLATVHIELRPEAAFAKVEPPTTENPMKQALREGWEQSLDVLGGAAAAVLTAAAFSWWMVVPVLALIFVVRRVLAARPAPTTVVDTTSGQP